RRTTPRPRTRRFVRARASGSDGRSARRPTAPPPARRRGSASRTWGTYSGASRLTRAERAYARPGRRSGSRPLVELRPPPRAAGCRSGGSEAERVPEARQRGLVALGGDEPRESRPDGAGKRREELLQLAGREAAR